MATNKAKIINKCWINVKIGAINWIKVNIRANNWLNIGINGVFRAWNNILCKIE